MTAPLDPRPPAGEARRPAPAEPARRRRVGTGAALTLVGVAVALLASGALLARDAVLAQEALAGAAARVGPVQDAVLARDAERTAELLGQVQALTATGRVHTDGPLWWAASAVPVVGDDVSAVSTVARALDDLTHVALPALLSAADAVAETDRQSDGTLRLTPLHDAADDLQRADATTQAALEDVTAIDTQDLVPQLAGPVTEMQAELERLAASVSSASRAATLLPRMLGGGTEPGTRTYLLLALNNAELRASGGIPGALALLRVDHGRVTVERQVGSSAVGPFADPVLPLDPGDVDTFGDRLGRYVQDVTLTPDFPTSARLMAEMWRQAQGEAVDGVVATDPVALSYALELTGPVEVAGPGGPAVLRSEDAVRRLLSDAYRVTDPAASDAFFAATAATVLSELARERPSDALPVLQRAGQEHRLLVWSAHEDEQALLAGTMLSGDLWAAERSADAVGVFLNDTLSGKMTYYLDSSVSVIGSTCGPEGRTSTLEVRLASTAPADAATALPWYVAGLPGGQGAPGTVRVNVVVVGPRGAAQAPRVSEGADGAWSPVGGDTTTVRERSAVAVSVALAPGGSTTLRAEVTSRPGAPATLDVWSTPTAHAGGLLPVEAGACGEG